MESAQVHAFQETVWDYFQAHARDLPWRHEPYDAYKILVSEIMLQQTQVPRVIPKFQAFITKFPDVKTLAQAPLADVLRMWSGLGYNRRAKYVHEAAKELFNKNEPWQLTDLTNCKGVGPNTAAAVLTYAYNQPVVFIETNVRTVFIHHFFADKDEISDKELLPLVEATLDHENARQWNWALMDYGSYLKASVGNIARASKHYAKQSKFEGSHRQIRGHVLRLLGTAPLSEKELQAIITDERLSSVLRELMSEGLIAHTAGQYMLAL